MQSQQGPVCAIVIDTLTLSMHIGAMEEERAARQPIAVEVRLFPKARPAACDDDVLEHTFCYDTVCSRIKARCQNARYKLLERLASVLHADIQSCTEEQAWIWLRVTKLEPPVDNLHAFHVTYSDVPAELMMRHGCAH